MTGWTIVEYDTSLYVDLEIWQMNLGKPPAKVLLDELTRAQASEITRALRAVGVDGGVILRSEQ